MKKLKVLIAGCGRSGTGYLANMLSENGYSCGHEKIFDVWGVNRESENQYESSWYAMPYLGNLDERVKVVHIVRRPDDVIRSFYKIGLFSPNLLQHLTYGHLGNFAFRCIANPPAAKRRYDFVAQHRRYFRENSDIFKLDDELSRLQAYWFQWNNRIADFGDKYPDRYLRTDIEKLAENKELFEGFLEMKLDLEKKVNRNKKSNYRRDPVDINHLSAEVVSLARRFGF